MRSREVHVHEVQRDTQVVDSGRLGGHATADGTLSAFEWPRVYENELHEPSLATLSRTFVTDARRALKPRLGQDDVDRELGFDSDDLGDYSRSPISPRPVTAAVRDADDGTSVLDAAKPPELPAVDLDPHVQQLIQRSVVLPEAKLYAPAGVHVGPLAGSADRLQGWRIELRIECQLPGDRQDKRIVRQNAVPFDGLPSMGSAKPRPRSPEPRPTTRRQSRPRAAEGRPT